MHLIPSLAKIQLARPFRVNGVTLVWVDHHTKQAAISLRIKSWLKKYASLRQTYIDELADVSRLEIPEHRGLVEVSHVGDVVKLLHFRRIDLHQLARLESLFLPANLSGNFMDYSLSERFFLL